MSYNKAKAEKEWLQWKEAEEKKMRELGVDEDTIQRLHTYDWVQFNKERRFLQRWNAWTPYVDHISAQELQIPEEAEDGLLNSVEDQNLLKLLRSIDRTTLKILILKMEGYSSKEIAVLVNMKENTVNQRISRLKKFFSFSVTFWLFLRAI